MEHTPSISIWSPVRKILFRFIFLFFGLIIFPFPLNIIPGVNSLLEFYNKIWERIAQFVGANVLGVTESLKITFTGSGDKMMDWLQYFSFLMLAVIVTVIWSILDRKRPNYERLLHWFVLFLTFYLAYFMFVYGIIKLFYLQFRPPNLERLFQTFGQASPMRLLWTFMGASETYTKFAGFSETIAGAFLVFRRTRTLGALIAVGVMFNVFMMNMSYDVPVKAFSFQLMAMGLFLAGLDAERLYRFFFLNQPVAPAKDDHVFSNRRGRRIVLAVQVVLVGYMVISQVVSSISAQKQYGTKRPKSPLYGVYNVETFVKNGDTIPPLLTDIDRWKRLLIDYPQFVSVVKMNDHIQRYNSELDTAKQYFTWTLGQDTVNRYEMEYGLVDDQLKIDGFLLGDTLRIHLRRYPMDNFGLLNRGFHWVNEVPYNRYNYD